MMVSVKKYFLLIFAILLLIITVVLGYFDWQDSHKKFTFTMLDVGQGDALFIESPTGIQILVDGGPPNKILGKLQQVMSPFDRNIDAIIITNPDQDHIAGLLDVLKIYKIGVVLESGTWNDSKIYQNLENEIRNKKIPNLLAKRGMMIDLGGDAKLEILFPDRSVFDWPTNDGSIVAKLSYKGNNFMLTGDATFKTENLILKDNNLANLKSDFLKVGHHGSRYSSSLEFIKAVSPKIALISVGKNNKYGHPSPEVLGALARLGVKIFRTDEIGTIIIKCDKMDRCTINK